MDDLANIPELNVNLDDSSIILIFHLTIESPFSEELIEVSSLVMRRST